MQKTIISNQKYFEEILSKIKKDGLEKLHILADFDKTLTKAFSNGNDGKIRQSLISVLRSEGYLGEEYSKKAYELYDYYHPIEIDPNISLDEKKKQMAIWWNKHLDLLVSSKLHKKDIEKVVFSGLIEFRSGVKEFLKFLSKNNIPLIIISANGLGSDSIKMYFEKQGFLTPNVQIISNEFSWDENGNVVGHSKKIIHVFNKDETVLKDFVEIHDLVENRKNVILLGDSLGDPHMIEGFLYNNLLKIGFLNEKEDELLEEYKKHYDVILTGDNDGEFLNSLFN
ncbi:MAG: hypothetical protein PHE25_03200 [Candidatus Gracilibacteria bacterium]|nr:hypothetical protein [Candidatus Gracilibacteria bacterium]